MILDLRDNGGGYVDSAVAICDALLPEGTVVSTKDRAGNEQKMTSDANMAEIPMVVLVNEATASASEITAGALQDYGRAKIVGMQTYGKGVVQSIRKLGDGGLKLTIAEYYTPNGRNLNGEGLMPDVEIDLPLELKNSPSKITEQNDTQLQKALELLSQEVATNQ